MSPERAGSLHVNCAFVEAIRVWPVGGCEWENGEKDVRVAERRLEGDQERAIRAL